jgi:hypothetical protein
MDKKKPPKKKGRPKSEPPKKPENALQNLHTKGEISDQKIIDAFYKFQAVKYVVANNLGMSRPTLDKRIKESKELQDAFEDAKEAAIEHVESKLMARINGYYHPEDKIFQFEGRPVVVPTIKHYPPDVKAIDIYLSANAKHKGYSDKEQDKAPADIVRVIYRLPDNGRRRDQNTGI